MHAGSVTLHAMYDFMYVDPIARSAVGVVASIAARMSDAPVKWSTMEQRSWPRAQVSLKMTIKPFGRYPTQQQVESWHTYTSKTCAYIWLKTTPTSALLTSQAGKRTRVVH